MYPSQMPERSLIPSTPALGLRSVQRPISPKVKARALARIGFLKPAAWLMNTEKGAYTRFFAGTALSFAGIAFYASRLDGLAAAVMVTGLSSFLTLLFQGLREGAHDISIFFENLFHEEVSRIQAEDRGEKFDDLGYW